MAIYLSPGVYPRETTISFAPTGSGPLRPVFIGTSNKGPVNIPYFISTPQQAIEIFGEPFPESYLMYAVLSYLEEGNNCYIIRIGVETAEGQEAELSATSIDTSGAKVNGWGRIPLFSGIDYGRITFRVVNAANPAVFHAASIDGIVYNDASLSATDGPTNSTMLFTGTGTSNAYTGCVDDTFIMIISGEPVTGQDLDGAAYQVIRNSDDTIVSEGTLVDDTTGKSQGIDIGQGLIFKIQVTNGQLSINDTFGFSAHPDNRSFSFSVEGATANAYVIPSATYSSVAALNVAINALIALEDYIAVSALNGAGVAIPVVRTTTSGERIQLMTSCGFAAELGSQQYAYDIPRAFLIGTAASPFAITSQNNRVKIKSIGLDTKEVEFSVPVGLGQDSDDIATIINLAGVVAGETIFQSFALTVPGGLQYVVIVTSTGRKSDTLQVLANFSNIKTLKFAEELGILYPQTRGYRGYTDTRLVLPDSSISDPAVPLSCEVDLLSAQCAEDSAYYENIVGWIIASSAGTWIDSYRFTLEQFTESLGDPAGRYKLTIKNTANLVVESIQDVTFDSRTARYIGNVLNPGTTLGGIDGNAFINWEARPSYLDNDENLSSFVVRNSSLLFGMTFEGGQNGIPTDPAFSNELDAAVIGNAAESTGLYALSNPETYDINLMATPGFTSGAVIGTALQICETRGDTLYLVDSPFGLRPQQVVDWHNGILLSDLQNSINSSYGALFHSWLKKEDVYNSQFVWVPPSGYVAGVFSRSARVAELWSAPAGLRRGRILTAVDVEYSPSSGERDLLYGTSNAVNPIVKDPKFGIYINGQKTLDRSGSPFNRINVRMLVNTIKVALKTQLLNYLFEPIDEILYAQVKNALDPILADYQSRRGLSGYRVIVDQTNNTPLRRARSELWVAVVLIPTTVAEFIVLDLGILNASQSLTSDETLAALGIVSRSPSSVLNP